MARWADHYLSSLVTDGTSDIHLKAGHPPWRRVHGDIERIDTDIVPYDQLERLACSFVGSETWERLGSMAEYETSYEIPGFARLRASIYRQRGLLSMAVRVVPIEIPDLDQLRVPQAAKTIAMSERGLVLVTGVAGSGKSSTLAAMIEHINQRKKCHIITIEDPIEFVHKDKQALINQREIGTDTGSFASAFRSALRQDPDIVLVGELRDTETMEIALQAADSGHLVLSSVHATDTKETIGRFIDVFPPQHQQQVRTQLAANLRAIVSQRLMHRVGTPGRVLAAEVMVANAAVREYIGLGRTDKVVENMAKGRQRYGSQTFDQALMELVESHAIDLEEATRHATSANDLKLGLSLGAERTAAPELSRGL